MQLSSTLCKSATYSINQSLEVAKGKVEIILIITGWVKKPSVSYKISQPSNNTRWVKKKHSEQPNYQEPSDQTTKNL